LQFAAADAERLTFAGAAFDRVLCGLGLMFFPDVPRALAEMRRVLRPGGLAVFSLWGEEARAPLVACALQCIRRILPPPKVERLSPFRFGDPALLQRTLADAGFAQIEIHAHLLSCAFDTPQAYWQAFRDLAGGAAARRACPRRCWRGWARKWRRNWRRAVRARATWRRARS
jgi:SAM-dependent methyltransferase